jgi:phosphoribosylaminoimidazolecarboxamide formyltransferase/IMP cyclohydrolase
MTEPKRKIRRALLSVSDKNGLIDFARSLAAQGIALISTGGSAKALREAGLAVKEVRDVTGFPEIMDGRVKTLHPAIHGGILARRDAGHHLAAQREHGIEDIDLVVINLYPFEETIAKGALRPETIENIDIGGPALIRAAAKNHEFVTVVVDPSDYTIVLSEIEARSGATGLTLRRRLARKAYARTSAYDAAIAAWMAREESEPFPERTIIAGERRQNLRYGENPHQRAAFYVTDRAIQGVGSATQLQGKELSYNNLNDTDAAWQLACEFEQPAIAIIKHANPCGVAIAPTLAEAYGKALACDRVSAFGGIIAANREMDGQTAEAVAALFSEVIIAPDFSPQALAVFARKANLRLLRTGGVPDSAAPGFDFKSLMGGFLIQERDRAKLDPSALQVATKRRPDDREMADLLFAFRVAKHVKSNAIVYAKEGASVGIGAGQMSRVDSARIAAWKAAEAAKAAGQTQSWAKGSAVASDAFFPFVDGLQALAAAGATSVIQPGGSVRDEEIVKCADDLGLAMVMTGMRHFRH